MFRLKFTLRSPHEQCFWSLAPVRYINCYHGRVTHCGRGTSALGGGSPRPSEGIGGAEARE